MNMMLSNSIIGTRVRQHWCGGVLLAALLTSGCDAGRTPQALIADAMLQQQKGDRQAAMIQLKNALQQAPDHAEARYLLGALYVAGGDAVSAEKELRKALALGFGAARVMPELGRALLMRGRNQQVLDEIGADDSEHAALLDLRGEAYLGLRDSARARALFQRSLERVPDAPDALIGLAKCALRERDLAAATRLSERALARDGGHAQSWLLKGDLLRVQGKLADALAAYDTALKLLPGNISLRLLKADLEIGAGQYVTAKADIDAARALAPEAAAVWYAQALLDFSQGRQQAALESIQRVLRVAPESMPAVLLAGMIENALGSVQQAQQHLIKYTRAHPEHLPASELLAAALLRGDQVERARAVLAPWLKKDVADARLWMLAGEIEMKARRPTMASRYFTRADALEPDSAVVHTALGTSALAEGRDGAGVAQLERAASLAPLTAEGATVLVGAYLRLNALDQALAVAGALAGRAPNNPAAHNLEGGVRLSRGDRGGARASFERALARQSAYAPALNNLARLDLAERRPAAARQRYVEVLKADPKNVPAMLALAELARTDGQRGPALAWLEQAVAVDPDALPATRALAGARLAQGDAGGALRVTRTFQARQPGVADGYALEGDIVAAGNDYGAAAAAYRKALAIDDSALMIRAFHHALVLAGDKSEADARLRGWIAAHPEQVETRMYMAQVALAAGEHKVAAGLLEEITASDAGNAPAWNNLALAYQLQHDPRALKAAESAYAMQPANPAVLDTLGAILSERGDQARALPLLEKASAMQPNAAPLRYHLARALAKSGARERARRELSALIESGAPFAGLGDAKALLRQL